MTKEKVENQETVVEGPATIGAEEKALTTPLPIHVRRGFEDEEEGDVVYPRAVILQSTSSELSDPRYEELNLKAGMLINSLTKEILPEIFTPVFKFNNRMLWVSKDAGGGMACRSMDNVTGIVLEESKWGPYNKEAKAFKIAYPVTNGQVIKCSTCPYSKWEGSTPPACMPSMNFFALFEGQSFPLILAFKSTSHKAGKKLYSMAKMMPGDMFDYNYRIKTTRRSNDKGTFFEADIFPGGKSTPDQANMGLQMYDLFKVHAKDLKYDDQEDSAANAAAAFENSVTDDM